MAYQIAEKPEVPFRRRSPRTSVYVYFVQAETLGLIKIGVAGEPDDRLYTLQCGSPDALRLLGVIKPSDSATSLERSLHRRFASERRHGEWFAPSAELIAYIAAHAEDFGAMLSRENRPLLNAALAPQ